MSIAEKLSELASDLPRVFEAGAAKEAANCAAKHFVCEIAGNGTGTVSFEMPFVPDYITVSSFNPFCISEVGALINLMYDLRSFGRLAGSSVYCRTENTTTLINVTQSGAASRFTFADGVCTVQNLGKVQNAETPIVFANGERYLITAQRYTDKTDKEIIAEYINSLVDDGGTITISEAKKEANFTEEEWNILINTKQSWTFNLV